MKAVIFLLLLAIGRVSAQPATFSRESSEFMTNAYGQPVYTQQKYNAEGTIFFPENYTLATITIPSGKKYRNIKVKINLLENWLQFSDDSSGSELIAVLPVSKIEFNDMNAVFVRLPGDSSNIFYQLLDSGRASLLKRINVSYKDKQSYGTTTITRAFEQKASYFAYANGKLEPIGKSKDAVCGVLQVKDHRLEAFIEKESLRLKKEEDLVKLFRYYNSLK